MRKYIIISVLTFLFIVSVALIINVNVEYAKKVEEEKQLQSQNQNENEILNSEKSFDEIKNEVLALGQWEDITEEDKITFAFGTTTEVVKRAVNSLEKGRYVICYAVGGRMDNENKGTYFIMTGFDEDGKVKILSPQNNYEEKSYIFERVFENVSKILFFDNLEVAVNE